MDNGITLKIDDSEFEKTFGAVLANLGNKKTALRQIGSIGKESVRMNFHQGGRPEKWEPSKRAKNKKIPGRTAATLRSRGILMNSITSEVRDESVLIGTNVVYAAVQHYGAVKGSFGTFTFQVKAHRRKRQSRNMKGGKSGRKKIASGVSFVKTHARTTKLPWGDIPARPFMLLQEEDIATIEMIMADHIVEGEA